MRWSEPPGINLGVSFVMTRRFPMSSKLFRFQRRPKPPRIPMPRERCGGRVRPAGGIICENITCGCDFVNES